MSAGLGAVQNCPNHGGKESAWTDEPEDGDGDGDGGVLPLHDGVARRGTKTEEERVFFSTELRIRLKANNIVS